MLRHIKATYVCDSCGEMEDWVMGNYYGGSWFSIDSIWNEIKFGILKGWIKGEYGNNGPQHWCPKCHMKKEIKDLTK